MWRENARVFLKKIEKVERGEQVGYNIKYMGFYIE